LIRTTLAATSLCLILWGSNALAQEGFEGLDLTEPEKKEEPKKEEPAPAPTPAPAPPVADQSGTTDAPAKDNAVTGERDVTQEDRVKSVQRKLYIKRGRFELAPYIAVIINDPYYTKWGGAIRGAFYLADTLAFSARFAYFDTRPTDDVRVAKKAFQSRIFFSVPKWTVMGDFEWSPVYGKVAIFNTILHFDAYAVGGAGVIYTETSELPGRTVNFAADLGFGMRFVVKDFLAINAAIIDTAYVDQPAGTTKATTQNMLMLYAGFSLFIPFKSTFREEE
jgi:outer membrane beta-barrel protein